MRGNAKSDEGAARSGSQFSTTLWSVVLTAGHLSSPGAQAALEQLCRSYWHPLYAYLRRSGYQPADAQDLIQSFFATVIERNWIGVADPAKGRFRSFLLVCLKRFVNGQTQKSTAQKRGGRLVIISLDDQEIAERYAQENDAELTPEAVYDRRWALTLLEQAWDLLRDECQATGKLPLFEHLRAAQSEETSRTSYQELAARLKMTESALKAALFRLRARYRELLRQAVAQTVDHPDDINDEIRYLVEVVSR